MLWRLIFSLREALKLHLSSLTPSHSHYLLTPTTFPPTLHSLFPLFVSGRTTTLTNSFSREITLYQFSRNKVLVKDVRQLAGRCQSFAGCHLEDFCRLRLSQLAGCSYFIRKSFASRSGGLQVVRRQLASRLLVVCCSSSCIISKLL